MKRFLLFILSVSCTICLAAKEFLPDDLDLDASITAPEEFLGFKLGQRHVQHYQLVAYLQLLASQSDRMQWIPYGETHGKRPLGQLLISAPGNLDRIEQIRITHLKLADPEHSDDLEIKSMPIVVNLNYSVHGNEASGANAAPVVAYYLAAAQGPNIDDLLEDMVILLDPALNPDGLDRFANWTNDNVGRNPNPDPNTREHKENWPNGRTNYYWFDLNRDWMLLTQPESRGRIRQYHEWMPNFVLDFHEMSTNATYFFQPGVPERTHPLIPQNVTGLTERVSRYFANALDEKNALYFSRERYDDFYMGKGSTIADLKGAIGILFEQASARGIIQDSDNGPVSFEFAISNQVSVSLAVLKGAYEMRQEFLDHTRDFFRDSIREAGKQPFSGYRFSSKQDPSRARCLVDIFKQHSIDVYPIAGEEAWYVPLRQPHYRYLEAMVEQRTDFEESIFYDITAWTLPLAYNLEWETLKKQPAVEESKSSSGSLDKSVMGYVFDWSNLNSPKVLLDLFQADIQVKVAKNPLHIKGRNFGYGSMFIPIGQQPEKAEEIHTILKSAVESHQLIVTPITTYSTEKGIDLGSGAFAAVSRPNILLVAGRGIDAYVAGSIWHLIDVYHDYPVTMVEPNQLEKMDLHDYTALVLPGADKGTYPLSLVARLKDWVRQGGTLVCLGNTPKWAIDNQLSSGFLVAPENEKPLQRRSFASASDDNALQDIKGAIFDTKLDTTHPLGYGYTSDRLPVFLNKKDFLAPSGNSYNTPLVYTDNPLMAGYASEENLAKLGGSAAVTVEPVGGGSIILFALDPTFRAYWRGTEKLLLNAILFGQLMDAEN